MTRMPDPWLVNLPRPFSESGKIHGHMTELKRPELHQQRVYIIQAEEQLEVGS
jgi:hypothetical protein